MDWIEILKKAGVGAVAAAVFVGFFGGMAMISGSIGRRRERKRATNPKTATRRRAAAPIEREIFAHVFEDASGSAARAFLEHRGKLPMSGLEAAILVEYLESWSVESKPEKAPPPADYIQKRWKKEGESYRSYVTGIMEKCEVPDQADHAGEVVRLLEKRQAIKA